MSDLKPIFSIKTAILIVIFFVVAHPILLGFFSLIIKYSYGNIQPEVFAVISAVCVVIVDFILIIILFKKYENNFKEQIKKVPLRLALLFFLLTFFIFLLIIPLASPWRFFSNLFESRLIVHQPSFELVSTLHFYSNFILGVIFIPVLEEIIYRGIIFNQFLKSYSVSISILVSSLLFALMHLNFAGIAYLFLYGLLFSFAYYRTKSILMPILLHVFINLMAPLTRNQFVELSSANFAKYVLFFIVSLGLILLLFSLINKGKNALEFSRCELNTDLKNLFTKSDS